MSDAEEKQQNLKCGFCRRGVEAQNVCGKLWHDAAKNCSAHQRCMQYSANLTQYDMKRFGGFKVAKVLKEQARGKRLKCTICGAGSKSKSKLHSACGASSGCADPKCRKSFHFYCARTGTGTVAHKMVETMSDDRKVDHYLVFCSKEHQERYQKKQKNRVSYVSDTDDEAYRSDAKDDSSDSDESTTSSDDKKTTGDSPPAQVRGATNDNVAQTNNNVTRSSGSLDSNDKWSDDDFDKTPTNTRRDGAEKTKKMKQKSSEESVGDVKRRKLATEADSPSTNTDVKSDPDNGVKTVLLPVI